MNPFLLWIIGLIPGLSIGFIIGLGLGHRRGMDDGERAVLDRQEAATRASWRMPAATRKELP